MLAAPASLRQKAAACLHQAENSLWAGDLPKQLALTLLCSHGLPCHGQPLAPVRVRLLLRTPHCSSGGTALPQLPWCLPCSTICNQQPAVTIAGRELPESCQPAHAVQPDLPAQAVERYNSSCTGGPSMHRQLSSLYGLAAACTWRRSLSNRSSQRQLCAIYVLAAACVWKRPPITRRLQPAV